MTVWVCAASEAIWFPTLIGQKQGNYPNPFNPEPWIPYVLSDPADIVIEIYAADGRLVRRLAIGHQYAGLYVNKASAAYWDGRNGFGEPAASGLYFYTLIADDYAVTRKMIVRR